MNDKVKFAVPKNISKITLNGGSITWDEDKGLLLPANCVVMKTDRTLLSLSDGVTVSDDGTVTSHGDVIIKEPNGMESTVFTPRGKTVVIQPNGNVVKPFGAATIVATPGRQPMTYLLKSPMTF